MTEMNDTSGRQLGSIQSRLDAVERAHRDQAEAMREQAALLRAVELGLTRLTEELKADRRVAKALLAAATTAGSFIGFVVTWASKHL